MGLSFFRKIQQRDRDRVIEIDGVDLPVRIVENDRAKRLTLRIVPGGEALKITVPGHVDDWEIDAFLERNRNWAAARLARLPQRTALGEGAVIPFRGVDHRVTSTGKLRGVVEAMEVAGEPIIRVPGDEGAIGRKCLAYLKRQARTDLDLAVAQHASKIDIRPKSLRITDSTSRWGSCSSTRTLSFSWRIIMAPSPVLNYLAAHEVAHLIEMNHSNRFWALTRELCPDMDAQKSWLRVNGAKLHAISV